MKPKRSRPRAPLSVPSSPRAGVPRAAWTRVRLFAMDIDGTLTDGTVTIHSDGTEAKTFSILDGLGLVRCRDAGIILAWISGRASRASALRANELQIPHLIQGRVDKLAALRELAGRVGVAAGEVCYMGDDDIDAPAIAWAGIGVTVPNAMPAAKAAADYICACAAGDGAVREVCDQLLNRPE